MCACACPPAARRRRRCSARARTAAAARPFTGGSVTLERHGARVRVVHETLGVLSDNAFVYLARRGEGCLTLENARYGTCRYLGDLYACVEDGALCLVNYVPLTQYLYGVTGGELRNSHPAEALKAQAIAAKGYALSCLGRATGPMT